MVEEPYSESWPSVAFRSMLNTCFELPSPVEECLLSNYCLSDGLEATWSSVLGDSTNSYLLAF
jgi:hypothetical protein